MEWLGYTTINPTSIWKLSKKEWEHHVIDYKQPQKKQKEIMYTYFKKQDGPIVTRENVRAIEPAKKRVVELCMAMINKCNSGYGIVPTQNTFTNPRAKFLYGHEIDGETRKATYSRWNLPSSPLITEEDKKGELVCYQVGFQGGRQGLFQACAIAKSGVNVSSLIGKVVQIAQEEGTSLCVLRGFEYIKELVPELAECAYMPIVREATLDDVKSLEAKLEMDYNVLQITREIKSSVIKIVGSDAQTDQKRIVFNAEFCSWTEFRPLVTRLHSEVENRLGTATRIYIQRKFKGIALKE